MIFGKNETNNESEKRGPRLRWIVKPNSGFFLAKLV
jgi:hypothetical protein